MNRPRGSERRDGRRGTATALGTLGILFLASLGPVAAALGNGPVVIPGAERPHGDASSAGSSPSGGPCTLADAIPGQLCPQAVEQLYDESGLLAHGYGGQEAIGVVDWCSPGLSSSDYLSNLQTFDSFYKLPNPPRLTPLGSGGTTCVQNFTADIEDETDIDVQWAHVMAPLAPIDLCLLSNEPNSSSSDQILVAECGNDLLAAGVGVISISYDASSCSPQDLAMISNATAQGVTIVASSGDTYTNGEGCPALSSNVLDVGGTNVELTGTTSASETPWEGPTDNGWTWETGGGCFSSPDGPPTWQAGMTGIGVCPAGDRGAPDVAALAGCDLTCVDVYTTTGWITGGGTSLSAPLWAGTLDAIQQAWAAGGRAEPEFMPPLLYQLAKGTDYHQLFNDITSGCSEPDSQFSGTVCATPGWDRLTGLGTPKIGALAAYFGPFFINTPTASPSNLTLGGSVTFADTGDGVGVTYNWTGLPPGCTNTGTFEVVCNPTALGSYTVRVFVNDSMGHHASASVVLQVSSAPSSNGLWALLTTPTTLIVIAIVLVMVVALVAVRARRAHRRSDAEGPAPEAPPRSGDEASPSPPTLHPPPPPSLHPPPPPPTD